MKKLHRIFAALFTLARELSDEGAYARHLQATGRQHSRTEWKRFTERHHGKKYQNAKCC